MGKLYGTRKHGVMAHNGEVGGGGSGGGAKSIIPVYVYGTQDYLDAKAEEVINAYHNNTLAGIKISGNTGFVVSQILWAINGISGDWYTFEGVYPGAEEGTAQFVLADWARGEWEFGDVPGYQSEGIDTKADLLANLTTYEDDRGVYVSIGQAQEYDYLFYKWTNEPVDIDNFMKTYDLSGFACIPGGSTTSGTIQREPGKDYLCVVTIDNLGAIVQVGVAKP